MKSFVSLGRVSPLALVSRRALPLVVAACTLLLAPAFAQTVTSVVPPYISYQGKITNSSGALVGTGTPVNRLVIFRIWNHQSNATNAELIYSEQQTVTISEGEFSVLIGQGSAVSGTPLGFSETAKGPPTVTVASAGVFGGATRYLGVTVDDGTSAADPEVSPRQQIVTSAYAFRAKYAESVGSNGTNTITALDNGNVGIGTTNPGARLDVNGVVNVFDSSKGNAGGIASEAGAGMIDFGMNDGRFGTQNTASQGGFYRLNTQSVSNLYQFYARPAGSTTLTEVMSITSAGNVGIGSTAPANKLDVAGGISLFDGSSGTRRFAGLGTEVNGALANFGVNDSRFGGTATQSDQGGFLRLDSRGGANLYQFFGRTAGSGSLSEILSITSSGNVGIGQSSPGAKLDVNGTVKAAGLALTGPLQVPGAATTHTQGAWLEWNKDNSSGTTYLLNQRGTGAGGMAFGEVDTANTVTEILRLKSGGPTLSVLSGNLNGTTDSNSITLDMPGNGTLGVWDNLAVSSNLGIGTNAPGFPLSFANALGDKISLWGSSGTHYGFGIQGSLLQIHTDTVGADVAFGYGTSASFAETMRIKGNGRVGIGTNNPTRGKLEVIGTNAGFVNGGYGYLNRNGASAFTGSQTIAYSFYTDGRIGTDAEFNALSDRRAKIVDGHSDGTADLRTLMQIEVTDYHYKDQIQKGTKAQKKVIGQQVEEVFPLAVNLSTNVVPDIYQATRIQDDWIQLATDLKPGERVKLITDAKSEVYEVLEVKSGSFRTSFRSRGEEVFVYGREVSDFRAVDYDAIAMLNVSATQEIKREKDAEVAALRAQNAELQQRITQLEAKDRARDAKLASIEKLLSSGQTVMARPAVSSTTNNAGGQE